MNPSFAMHPGRIEQALADDRPLDDLSSIRARVPQHMRCDCSSTALTILTLAMSMQAREKMHPTCRPKKETLERRVAEKKAALHAKRGVRGAARLTRPAKRSAESSSRNVVGTGFGRKAAPAVKAGAPTGLGRKVGPAARPGRVGWTAAPGRGSRGAMGSKFSGTQTAGRARTKRKVFTKSK